MTKVLSVTEFRSNLAEELEQVCGDKRNQIIIKRPKGKGNVVVLSQEAFNAIEESLYLLSTPNNKKHLLDSIQELNDGKGIKFKQEDIWK
jgi:antitoxin YefM